MKLVKLDSRYSSLSSASTKIGEWGRPKKKRLLGNYSAYSELIAFYILTSAIIEEAEDIAELAAIEEFSEDCSKLRLF